MYYCEVCFFHLMIYHDYLFRSIQAYVTHSFDGCMFYRQDASLFIQPSPCWWTLRWFCRGVSINSRMLWSLCLHKENNAVREYVDFKPQ